MKNGTIKISEKEFISILKQYYEKQNAEVEIITGKKYAGIYEKEVSSTTIKLTKNLKIGNGMATLTEYLTEEDVLTVIKTLLEDSEYEPLNLIYLNQMECRGYGYAESMVPVFKGVEIGIAKKKEKKFTKTL